LFLADFTGVAGADLDGFGLRNEATFSGITQIGTVDQNLWHVTERRANDLGHSADHSLYFGNDSAGNYELQINNIPQRVLGRAYFTIDLQNVPMGAQLSLAYKYFMETEGANGNFDRVVVNASKDFSNPLEPITTLHGSHDRLIDRSGVWKSIVSLDLGQITGPSIQVSFDFDSVDEIYNNFEGFYVDDVQVRMVGVSLTASTHLARIAGLANEYFGYSVARVGDLNGDQVPEFATLSQGASGRVMVFSGASQPWTPGLVYDAETIKYAVVSGASMSTYELLEAGNVIADNGTPFADFILNSTSSQTDPIFVVSGAAIAAGGNYTFASASRTIPRGFAVPLGNIDGVGADELGLILGNPADSVDESGYRQWHLVGQVFFGGTEAPAPSTPLFTKPDLVVEPGSPFYGPDDNPDIPSWFFGPLGNVDGNASGRSSFAMADIVSGRRLSIYKGRALANNFATLGTSSVSDVYQHEMARPLPVIPAVISRQINLSDPATSNHYVGASAVLEGAT
ncbi:MAG: hypothetical protein ABL921_35925, partial [Pirellula sp.]